MNRRETIKQLALALPAIRFRNDLTRLFRNQTIISDEPITTGLFKPTWDSLAQYKTLDWFRDAKFGIWAHWGPQCQPEAGDWYARGMYQEGSRQYKYHLEKYGHPSKFGFKDVINEWKAEKWNPDELVGLYKKAGARYFFAMANHHDNFDNYDSKYQKNWNATKLGPKKDVIGGWVRAARANDLPFGVSVHASHTWSWLEPSQLTDKNNVAFDGNVTRQQGKGKWWDGLDPQELYAQQHPLSVGAEKPSSIHKQWEWGNGASVPSAAYCRKFLNRTLDLINHYNPDLLYFDDTVLPFHPINDIGLQIAAHFYNHNMKRHGGRLEAVLNGKVLDEAQRKCMVWDVERGHSNKIEPFVWQTDTCIGDWHYNRDVYDKDRYKTAKTVVHTLVDVVSKNGNLLLNIPVRGDGSIDEKERQVVAGITDWMQQYSDCIYDTRPWKIFGEGPALEGAAAPVAQGFNEGKDKPFTAEDVRFTTKKDRLYAILMGKPSGETVVIKSLATDSAYHPKAITNVSVAGSNQKLAFTRKADGLHVTIPDRLANDTALPLQIV
ncbi:alpha-L-fucosidase [Spirosoma sp. KUDC1026]|uniref:alpha-L-fucosidase n=1 Tax=Spirosoma sp. KUDC1026 TaxID=2745947 RepID=UPI00159BA054|nr:alpha-L-fucosidase [Spirosoma sp. KUDC1026]QKZ14161.1 alpha-L-fucosidase [Spirosoma sp. KUDC1026]